MWLHWTVSDGTRHVLSTQLTPSLVLSWLPSRTDTSSTGNWSLSTTFGNTRRMDLQTCRGRQKNYYNNNTCLLCAKNRLQYFFLMHVPTSDVVPHILLSLDRTPDTPQYSWHCTVPICACHLWATLHPAALDTTGSSIDICCH